MTRALYLMRSERRPVDTSYVNITTTCPSCGDVDLDIGAVRLSQVRGLPSRDVSFRCPRCDHRVRVAVDDARVESLLAAGVPLVFLSPAHPSLRDRPAHPERPPTGPPFTHDDLVDLHQLLADPDWYLRLLRSLD